jgi:hypothetical protein
MMRHNETFEEEEETDGPYPGPFSPYVDFSTSTRGAGGGKSSSSGGSCGVTQGVHYGQTVSVGAAAPPAAGGSGRFFNDEDGGREEADADVYGQAGRGGGGGDADVDAQEHALMDENGEQWATLLHEVGAVNVECSWTHSLKSPGFNP